MSLTELRKPGAEPGYLIRLKSFRNVNKWAPPRTMSRHSTSSRKERKEMNKKMEGKREEGRKEEREERKRGGRAKATATMVLEAVPATGGKQQPR